MSVQGWSNRWLNRLFKVVAICLVLVAVLLSGLRLLLPYADNYRLNFQNYVNQSYRSNIKVGELTTGWRKFGPTIVAKNVSLFESDAVKIFIEEIDVHVDFWQSIQERRLKTNDFTLIGAKIKLDKTLLAKSNGGNATSDSGPDVTGISNLFLQQVERFTIKDSQLFVQDFHDKHRRFLISELAWLNEGQRHRAAGDIEVDGVTKNTLKLQMDLTGDELNKIDGQLYLSGENINITPWLGRFTDVETAHARTDINFQSWFEIHNGHPVKTHIQLGNNAINWEQDDIEHSLSLNEGAIQIVHNPITLESYLFTSELNIVKDGQPWPTFVGQYQFTPNFQSGYISTIDIKQIAALYPLIESDTEKLSWLNQLDLSGKVNHIYLRSQGETLDVAANFSEIGWRYIDGIPGISKLEGNVAYNENGVLLSMHSDNGQIDFEQLFEKPIPYHRIDSKIWFQSLDEGWQINVPELLLISDELMLNGGLSLIKDNQAPIVMRLAAELNDIDAADARYYYPHGYMGDDLIKYLNTSLLEGNVASAKVVIDGPLEAFPYGNNDGTFIVDAELENSKFKFSPSWPEITEFNANLNFTNQSMLISAKQGSLKDIDVNGVSAAIDNLMKNSVLVVKSDIKEHPRAITELMNDSPLKDSVGKTLEKVIISGEITGDFDLTVPLNSTEDTVANGTIYFNDNEIDLTSPEMTFTNVNGNLSFSNEKITTSEIKLNWLDMPVRATVNANQHDNQYQTKIALSANWPQPNWQVYVPESLKSYADGQLDWQGELVMNHSDNGGFDYQAELNSNLKSLNYKLPAPFIKQTEDKQSLLVTVNGDLDNSAINISLGDDLNFYGDLAHSPTQFERAHLVMGEEQMFMPAKGFHISVDLAEANYKQWHKLVSDIINMSPTVDVIEEQSQSVALIERPQRIRGVIAKADVFGENLTQVSFDMRDLSDWWQVEVNAQQLRAQAKLYHSWQELGAEISADFLKLASNNSESVSEVEAENEPLPLDAIMSPQDARSLIAEMVPIRFQCQTCQVNNVNFGEMTFSIRKASEDKVVLAGFNSKRDNTRLVMSGSWQIDQQNRHKTYLQGSYVAPDVENEMRLLGYDSIVRDSGIQVNFDTNWSGAPTDFAFSRLNGELYSRLDDGYLADVDDKGVRLLSVLSLRSLVRKLTLDFRDIFSKGMFYDEISGDFTLQNGVLYTDNLAMDGTAGDLKMKGNTNLALGELDYSLSFTPNVTSSLPVIVAWMTANPMIGLAALAVDGVIQSAEVISEINYQLTGTVDNPEFKVIDQKSRDVTIGQSKPTAVAEQEETLDPTIPQLNLNNEQQKPIEN